MKNNFMSLIITVVFVIFGLVLSIYIGAIHAWVILILALVGVFCISHPRILLGAYWCWAALTPYFNNMFVRNALIRWGDEAILAGMIVVLVATSAIKKQTIRWESNISKFLVGLLIVIAVSAVLNNSSPVGCVRFMLSYLRPFVLLAYSYQYLRPSDALLILKINLWIMGIQLLMNIGWLTGISPLPTYRAKIDIATGTFESSSITAYYCAMFIYSALSAVLVAKKNKKVVSIAIIIAVVCFVLFYFTFATHAIILFLLSFPLLLFIRRGYAKMLINAGLAIILIAFLLFQWEANQHGRLNTSAYKLTAKGLMSYWNNFMFTPKGLAYKNIVFSKPPEMIDPAIGAGPGRMGSTYAIMSFQPLAIKYFNYAFMTYDAGLRGAATSIVGVPWCLFLAVWSEIGYIGSVVFWLFHAAIFWKIFSFLRKKRNLLAKQNYLLQTYAEALVPMIPFYCILGLLNDISRWTAVSGIWIIIGLVLKSMQIVTMKERDANEEAENQNDTKNNKYLFANS